MNLTVDKKYFYQLLDEKYFAYFKNKQSNKESLIDMLSVDMGVSSRTIYNFMNNVYSTKLLKNVINTLDITPEKFYRLFGLYFNEEYFKKVVGGI